MIPDAGDQVLGADQSAPGGVDQDDAVFHQGDGTLVDQVPGMAGQRAVEADQVAAPEQLLQRDIGDPVQSVFGVRVIGQHLHAEAPADTGHSQADLAGAHDTGGLAMEVDPGQTVEGEVVFTAFDIGLMGVAVGGQGQGHGVFRHRLRRVARHPQHRDIVALGGLQIHMVVARAAQQNQFDAAIGQGIDHSCAQVGVDKGAHRFVAAGQRRGFRQQIGLNIFEFQAGIGGEHCVKGGGVIGLCAVEEDFHDLYFLPVIDLYHVIFCQLPSLLYLPGKAGREQRGFCGKDG